jgi:hypothetical protein
VPRWQYLIPVPLIDLKFPNAFAAGEPGLQIGGSSRFRPHHDAVANPLK